MQMSDLSKKKQFKYLDVPLEDAWKVSILQELLNIIMIIEQFIY